IVKNINNLATDLGLNTIAEGVETQAQAEILKEMGCTVIQGYYIGKAMNKEKAYAFIKEKNS
ncbi:EAL domain-containing protein, partial [bacterium]|nr:EAL domain-containing protein [bacterium]